METITESDMEALPWEPAPWCNPSVLLLCLSELKGLQQIATMRFAYQDSETPRMSLLLMARILERELYHYQGLVFFCRTDICLVTARLMVKKGMAKEGLKLGQIYGYLLEETKNLALVATLGWIGGDLVRANDFCQHLFDQAQEFFQKAAHTCSW